MKYSDDDKIWRYMELGKFISMLKNQAIYFSRPDHFNDPFEGFKPKSHVQAEAQVIKKVFKEYFSDLGSRLFEVNFPNLESLLLLAASHESNLKFGVSCWHANKYENEAMWRLYDNDSIAVVSTVGRLKKSLAALDGLIIKDVRYDDFSNCCIEQGHEHYSLVQKRKSFEYENEIRAIVPIDPQSNGINVPCNIQDLIEEVYVSPLAGRYLIDSTKFILDKSNLSDQIVKASSLLDRPCLKYYTNQ